MSVGTKVVLENLQAPTQFDIMYTPMNTGSIEVMKCIVLGTVGSLSCQTFEMLAFLLTLIIRVTEEEREDVINLMMKRLGVQKSVIVFRQIFMGALYCGIFAYLAALLFWSYLF